VFDQAFVINLDRRPDRWESFRAQRLPFDVERVTAIDRQAVGEPATWSTPGGSYATFQSHLKAWKLAQKRKANTVVVFEDDAIIPRRFKHRLTAFLEAVPQDWQGLHLETEANKTPGGNALHPGLIADHVSGNVLRARFAIGAVAYVLREPLITRAIESPHHGHVDRYLQTFQLEGRWYLPKRMIVRHHGGFESDQPPYWRT